MRSCISAASAIVAFIGVASLAGAQGTLSTQGFGYPPGQLSARALGTGGGLALFDPDSPLNPAALASSADARVFFQYEPEFRRYTDGSGSARTLTARFPLTSAAIPFGSRGAFGLSVSTFLDRSSSTTSERQVTVGDQTATVTENLRLLGAINDVRLAVGYALTPRIQVGLGGHVLTGENRVLFVQSFPDSLNFTPVAQSSTLDYTGFAISGGAVLRPSSVLVLALSGRKGATIKVKSNDTTVSEANVPDRIAAAFSYEGITGASVSGQVARETWSSLNGLGTEATTASDAWEAGVGLETAGPRIAERLIVFRVGARYRTLPFQAAAADVEELSFSGGVGAQFFRNRAAFDMTLQYSARSAAAAVLESAKERAFILSFGLRVRP